jgi:hypothetical protein
METRFSIVKMSILSSAICKFNVIPIRIPKTRRDMVERLVCKFDLSSNPSPTKTK